MKLTRSIISLFSAVAVITSFSCGLSENVSNSQESSQVTETNGQKQEESLSIGYISVTDGEKAVDLCDSIDGSAIVKMFSGDSVTVYSINGEWAKINYGGKDGYVKLANISFSEPVITDEPVKAEENTVQNTEIITEIPAEQHQEEKSDSQPIINNEIKNEINVVLLTDNDGFQVADPVKSYPSYAPQQSGQDGYCNTYATYIFSQPDINSIKRETDMLYQGDPVKILGSVNGWYYISTDNGSNGLLHGYVSQSYINLGKNEVQKINYSATQGQVKAGMTAWVNYSPSKTDNKEVLSGGTGFSIIGNANDYWYQIEYYGGTGWISYKMVDVW